MNNNHQGEAPPAPGRSAPHNTAQQTPFGGKKPKLSGAQRRKAAKQKASTRLGGAPLRPLSAELLAPVRVEDLETVSGYRRELNRVYGQMRAGQMQPELGTKLAYVLNTGASLARIEQELHEAALIRDELMKITSAKDTARGHGGQDYLPTMHDSEVGE